jgi:hypothetical protein
MRPPVRSNSQKADGILCDPVIPTLVHCGYHKCLTVFVNRCFMHVLGDRYHHFVGRLDEFYAEHERYMVSATTDCALDLSRIDNYRVSRFIRDPRDLVVSGYFYHSKGIEAWTTREHATLDEWRATGACPSAMRPGESYAACLRRLDQEDGLIAEMEFRGPHLRSMLEWPTTDPRVRVWKYEDILGHEAQVMDEVTAHYGWSESESSSLREAIRTEAVRWQAGEGRLSWDSHVRDPKSGQWRDLFTGKVQRAFAELFGNLPQQLGYE